jgi:Mn2+/Fe2+ NRAMP family transporter
MSLATSPAPAAAPPPLAAGPAERIAPDLNATRRTSLRQRLLRFLVVAGPGLIVMVADNDAGAVSTYTQAGARYGTALLWVLPILFPITYFVQEMVARLGIATGEGLAATIYNRFGAGWGRISLASLLTVNFLTLVTEFAAIALASRHLGLSPLVAVPTAGVALLLLVATGSYRRWERLTLMLCGLNLGWIVLAVAVGPHWGTALAAATIPHAPAGGVTGDFVFLAMAIVGTTIAPWQLFFQQSCVADKELGVADLRMARLDTAAGAVAVVVFAACMMLVGEAVFRNGADYQDPAQMAFILRPLVGWGGTALLLLLMINAALVGATAVSLSSAWAWGEVMGLRNMLQKNVAEAPQFYLAYALSVGTAAVITLIPEAPLQVIIIGVQVLSGVMLLPAIVCLQLLLKDRAILGPQLVNRAWNSRVSWTIASVLFGLSLLLAGQALLPGAVASRLTPGASESEARS